jgi:hypothetical protein
MYWSKINSLDTFLGLSANQNYGMKKSVANSKNRALKAIHETGVIKWHQKTKSAVGWKVVIETTGQ